MASYYNTTKGLLSFSAKKKEYTFPPKAYTEVDPGDQGHSELLSLVRSKKLKRIENDVLTEIAEQKEVLEIPSLVFIEKINHVEDVGISTVIDIESSVDIAIDSNERKSSKIKPSKILQ